MPSAIEQQLARHRRRIIEREEQAFRELLMAYEVIESDLRREYRELQRRMIAARDAGEEISEAWLYRERRLAALIDQVKQQIERFGRTAAAITTREQRAAITLAAEQSREVLRILGGPADLGFTLPTRVVEDAVGMMGNGSPILEYYREQLAPKVAEMIRIEVIKAAAAGTDFRTIANRLLTTGQITRTRALMVARTEVNRVRREATRQAYIESGVTLQWEWVASKSIRTCPACLWLDGQRFELKDPFPQHPNCLISGTVVNSPQTKAATRRWYDGEVVEVETSSGFQLTVTPNHPIMTRQGWVAAGRLDETSEIICTLDGERVCVDIDPHADNMPAVVDEIFGASLEGRGMPAVVVPHSAEYFHGDGEGGDVDIVFIDSFLENDVDSTIPQPARQNGLIFRGMGPGSLFSGSTADELGMRPFSSANGVMGGRGVPGVLLGGSLCHHYSVRVGDGSDLHTLLDQPPTDYGPVGFEGLRDLVFGGTGQISFGDLRGRETNASRLGKAAIGELGVEPISPDVEFCADFANRHAGSIRADRPIKIRRYFYSGHVYNLETSTGYYIANGIVTHNCRCTMIPVIEGVEPPARTLGRDWVQTLDEDDQAEIFGKEAAAALERGEITHGDLVGWRNSKEFGRSIYTKPLSAVMDAGGEK